MSLEDGKNGNWKKKGSFPGDDGKIKTEGRVRMGKQREKVGNRES